MNRKTSVTGQLSKFMVAGGSSREISTAFVVHEFNIIKDIKNHDSKSYSNLFES